MPLLFREERAADFGVILISFQLVPIAQRGEPELFFEETGEIKLVFKAHGEGNFADGFVVALQEHSRFVQAGVDDMLPGRDAEGTFEQGAEIARVQRHQVREVFQGNRLLIILVHVLQDGDEARLLGIYVGCVFKQLGKEQHKRAVGVKEFLRRVARKILHDGFEQLPVALVGGHAVGKLHELGEVGKGCIDLEMAEVVSENVAFAAHDGVLRNKVDEIGLHSDGFIPEIEVCAAVRDEIESIVRIKSDDILPERPDADKIRLVDFDFQVAENI